MSTRSKARFVVAAATMLAVQACWANDSGAWSAGTGFNYTSGKYGESTTTEITSIPFSLAYDKGPWSVKFTVPYLRIRGAEDVVVVSGGRARKTRPTTTTQMVHTDSGLGDLVAAATYNFYNNPAAQFGADVTGKIKFGTADRDKGLGTGQNDYTVQLDVYKRYSPQWTAFGAVGYAFLGSSADISLNDVLNLAAGAIYKIGARSSAGFAYDYRQKASETGSAQNELSAFFVHRLNKTWRAQAYLLKGLTDGSPDWGGGASVGYAF